MASQANGTDTCTPVEENQDIITTGTYADEERPLVEAQSHHTRPALSSIAGVITVLLLGAHKHNNANIHLAQR